jgi:hypothetical protein
MLVDGFGRLIIILRSYDQYAQYGRSAFSEPSGSAGNASHSVRRAHRLQTRGRRLSQHPALLRSLVRYRAVDTFKEAGPRLVFAS